MAKPNYSFEKRQRELAKKKKKEEKEKEKAGRKATPGESDTAQGPSADESASAPASVTPKNVAHRGGTPNQSADALRQQFGAAVRRIDVVWGETTVVIDPARVHDAIQWLHDDSSQRYDYLSDVTAVEFRDLEQPLEILPLGIA